MEGGYHPPLKGELDALPSLREAWKRKAELATSTASPAAMSKELEALMHQRQKVGRAAMACHW